MQPVARGAHRFAPGEATHAWEQKHMPSEMRRRTIWIAGATLLALFAGYLIWPAASFYRLASAVEAKDVEALANQVDFPALQRSLRRQIVETYFEVAGRKQRKRKLSLIEESVALSAGRSLAQALVLALVHEKTLLDLLVRGEAEGGETLDARLTPTPETAPFANISSAIRAFSFWWDTEYRGRHYYAYLPPAKPREAQFRVKLSLSDWRWKLSGLEIPRSLRLELARKAFKRSKDQKD
jgi:hypothetical protein